ncbi:hypothetical protein ACR780_10130 [Sphingobacterium faecium]|uniref:hypothetical protein n=1 Tax=Sphingobacterium faecium TaxID=34087 RepID=UPI003DA5D20E
MDGTPVAGKAWSSGQRLEQGDYLGAAGDFSTALAEGFTMGFSSKMASASANLLSRWLGNSSVKTGGNIALGVREYLGNFSKKVGGITWETWGTKNFQMQFLETINNPSNKIHFNLDGVGNVWKAVSDGAKGFGKSQYVTSWELYQIYSNPNVLNRTIFYQGGKVIPNPF